MKKLLIAAALSLAVAGTTHAQVLFDNTAGVNGASPRGPLGTPTPGIGQGFTFATPATITQFGFLFNSSTGGVFKFFIANAASTIVFSNVKTIAAGSTPSVMLSDVFSLAVAGGSMLSFGLIAQDAATQYDAYFHFPAEVLTQNGATIQGFNENFVNFSDPTQVGPGSVTFGTQIRGTAGTVTTTPEPTSLTLAATGLIGVCALARRRRRPARGSRRRRGGQ